MAGDYDFALKPAEVENLRKFLARRRHDHLQRRPRPGRVLPRRRPRDAQGLPAEAVHAPAARPPDLQRPLPPQQVMMMVNGVQFDAAAGGLLDRHRHAGRRHPGAGRPGHGPDRRRRITRPASTSSASRPSGWASTWSPTCSAAPSTAGSWPRNFPSTTAGPRPGDVFRFAAVRYSGSWDVNPALAEQPAARA